MIESEYDSRNPQILAAKNLGSNQKGICSFGNKAGNKLHTQSRIHAYLEQFRTSQLQNSTPT
jgi:hypothetical protein